MKKALDIQALNKTYSNGVVALKHMDLAVEAGDFFALLGPNGAGKTTTIGIITSLVNATSGRVSVFGHDIKKHPHTAKSYIGVVPQEFNFSIFEPVWQILMNNAGYYGVPRPLAQERGAYYLKKLDLWDKRNTTARNLSGGMKRRLMIARAMMHEPRLLILDEPTAGVDVEIRRSMWHFLNELNKKGTTIILTTHYLEEAQMLCKHIAIMDKGQIIEHTTMDLLLEQLNQETYVLNTKAPLGEHPIHLEHGTVRITGKHQLEIDIQQTHSLNHCFAALSQQHIEVMHLRNKANRLETLYLKLIEKDTP